MLKKRTRILAKVKSIFRKPHKYKFGVQVPIGVAKYNKLDNDNDNTLWQGVIKKEMEIFRVHFQLLDPEDKSPVGYKEITCHFVFDMKMDLNQKSRYTTGGHITDTPSSMIYSSVVSQEIVGIYFFVATLNYLDIISGYIHNASINSDTKEKIILNARDKWKSDQGKVVVIVRALYGLK